MQVVAAPSEKYGEEVAAFVILHDWADLTPEDVRDYCRGRIAWHKIPRYVGMVSEYPLTASGKVKKNILRQQAAELVATEAERTRDELMGEMERERERDPEMR